jgi:hypothetical protein
MVAYAITPLALLGLLQLPLDEWFKALYELRTLILRIYTSIELA